MDGSTFGFVSLAKSAREAAAAASKQERKERKDCIFLLVHSNGDKIKARERETPSPSPSSKVFIYEEERRRTQFLCPSSVQRSLPVFSSVLLLFSFFFGQRPV
jgi:hypothetical protein